MKPTSMIWFALIAACGLACCTVGNAQTKSTASQVAPTSAKAKQASDETPAVTDKRRGELMRFIKKHHPELRPLLNSLRKNRPEQFQSALRTLDVEIKRLQALEKRSPGRYKIFLGQWIVKSKIKLVAAKLVTKKKDEEKEQVKKDLKALIIKQHDLRVTLLADDIALTKKRLQKLEAVRNDLKTNRTAKVLQQLNVFIKNAQRTLAKQKKAAEARKKQEKLAKPAGSAPPKKTK